MLLTIRDLNPGDVRYLYCSDPRLKKELARIRCRGPAPVKHVETERPRPMSEPDPSSTSQPAA